jgi:membrane-associated phospholipid phosphatase
MFTRSSLGLAALLVALTPGLARAQGDAPADEPPGPAYQLHLGVDLPVLGALTTITVTRLFAHGKVDCAPRCDPAEINRFDRVTAGYWSPAWQKAGDAGLYGILLGSALVLGIDEGVWRGLNDATVVTESIMAAAAFSSILTLAADRPRPFLYGDKAPMSPREISNAGMSFLSGHAAVGFAAASALFITERRLHPGSAEPWIVFGAGSAVATFISVARVMGGNHFISDNLFGALAGASMGVMFPALHGKPVRLVPLAGDSQRGLALAGLY